MFHHANKIKSKLLKIMKMQQQALLFLLLLLKVAGSIPDEVTGFFNSSNSSSRHYGPRVDSASNRNEYQESSWSVKGGRRVRLTTSPPFVSRLENVGDSTSHNPMDHHGLLQG
jgi:hypothetical protein